MKDKEKQIEEMAKEMSKELCCYYDKKKRKCINCFGMEEDCDLHCNFGRTLERLSNAGYQKIDKDSIVLSRKEYEEVKRYQSYIPEMKKAFDKVHNNASKETAEKIFQELLKEAKTHEFGGWIEIEAINVYKMLIDKAKQFGVEIKG